MSAAGVSTKIGRRHLDRVAVVYVRQSTLAQVREHTESTARQYALAEQAVALGWDRRDVAVIDADLGVSGRSTEGRDGFRALVSRVCLGEVGAIFGLEISRLARSSADLSRLLELARLTDTLLIDGDGVYDLTDFNDRLLLGLKGTMSEAELHLLAGRLQGAKRAAAARGELRTPTGRLRLRRQRPRSPTCSPPLPRPARPTRWWLRSPGAGSRCAPTAGRGPGSCAGVGSPTPASWGS